MRLVPLLLVGSAALACQDAPAPPATSLSGRTGAMGLDFGFGGGAGDTQSTVPAPTVTPLPPATFDNLRTPHRVTVSPTGLIAVSDPQGHAVHVLWPDLARRATLTAVSQPLGCAIDVLDNVAIGDASDGAIRVFDLTGAPLATWGLGQLQKPSDLAYDYAADRLWVSDSLTDRVVAFDRTTGSVSVVVESGQAGVPAFHFPTGIAVDPVGSKLYVVDHNGARVVVLSLDGAPIKTFGAYGGGPGQFMRPQGIALDLTGRLYVSDAYHGRVQVLDADGKHITWIGASGPGETPFALPSDVAIDGYGRLLVTTYRGRALAVLGLDSWQTPPPHPPAPLALSLTLKPSSLRIGAPHKKRLRVRIESSEADLTLIDLSSIVLDGVQAPSGPPKLKAPSPGDGADSKGQDDDDDDAKPPHANGKHHGKGHKGKPGHKGKAGHKGKHGYPGASDADDLPQSAWVKAKFATDALISRLGVPGTYTLAITATLSTGELLRGETALILLPADQGDEE